MLTAEGADYAQMKKVAEALRQRLLKVKAVTQGQSVRNAGRKDLRRVLEHQACDARITTDQIFRSLARQMLWCRRCR